MRTYEQLTKDARRLEEWIKMLMRQADNKNEFPVAWFTLTDEAEVPYQLVAGWTEGFCEAENEFLFIIGTKALSIKVIPNYNFRGHNFESVSMPVDKSGVREDICMILERDEDVSGLALFFLNEIDRLTKEYHSVD